MFDAIKSKLFAPLMEAFAVFLSLDKATATESEIHNAIDGQKPLAEQISEARAAGAGDMTAATARISELETELATATARIPELETELATATARVAEVQVEMAAAQVANEAAVAAMKSAHGKEVSVLAGQVAALKAGRTTETEEGDAGHEAAGVGGDASGSSMIVLKSDALKDLLAKKA